MPYGFNEDKTRFDLSETLSKIADLEDMIPGSGESVDGIRARLSQAETNIAGLTAGHDSLMNLIGAGSTDIGRRLFWASPVGAAGSASFRAIAPEDLPTGIPSSKIDGLGKRYNSKAQNQVIYGDTYFQQLIGRGNGWDDELPKGNYIVVAGVKWNPKAGGWREIVLTDSFRFGDAEKWYCGSTLEPIAGGQNDYRTHQVIRIMTSDGTLVPELWVRQNTGNGIRAYGKMYAIRIS